MPQAKLSNFWGHETRFCCTGNVCSCLVAIFAFLWGCQTGNPPIYSFSKWTTIYSWIKSSTIRSNFFFVELVLVLIMKLVLCIIYLVPYFPACQGTLNLLCLFYQVISRLAPFERGIYEDYVANFWCSTSVLIKWKRLLAIKPLKLISLSATILAFLPSFVQQVKSPSNLGFLYALLNSSFSFYLFSYQGIFNR